MMMSLKKTVGKTGNWIKEYRVFFTFFLSYSSMFIFKLLSALL